MKITIKRLNDAHHMQATNEDGNSLLMDSSIDAGGTNFGMRPMQLLLSAIGGCSAIDVVSILKKQKQEVANFEIEVDGTREKIKDYSLFKKIHLHFKVSGNVDKIKVDKAIQLSLEKYCSVAKTLEPTSSITYTLTIN